MIVWHDTVHIHSKVMQVKHGLGKWEVYHPYGTGQGVLTVTEGDSSTPPEEIRAICRVKGVWRVITDEEYMIITVHDVARWTQIQAEVLQAYVIAKEKVDATTNNKHSR